MAPSPSASNPSVGEYIRHIPATVWVTFKALVFGVVVLMCIGGLLMLAGFCFAAMSGFLGGFFSAAKKRWTENRRKKQMKKRWAREDEERRQEGGGQQEPLNGEGERGKEADEETLCEEETAGGKESV